MLLKHLKVGSKYIWKNARFLFPPPQNISRLAAEGFADGFECGQPYCFCFAVFQDGEVGHGDADFFCKLGDAHLSFGEHDVYKGNIHAIPEARMILMMTAIDTY